MLQARAANQSLFFYAIKNKIKIEEYEHKYKGKPELLASNYVDTFKQNNTKWRNLQNIQPLTLNRI